MQLHSSRPAHSTGSTRSRTSKRSCACCRPDRAIGTSSSRRSIGPRPALALASTRRSWIYRSAASRSRPICRRHADLSAGSRCATGSHRGTSRHDILRARSHRRLEPPAACRTPQPARSCLRDRNPAKVDQFIRRGRNSGARVHALPASRARKCLDFGGRYTGAFVAQRPTRRRHDPLAVLAHAAYLQPARSR
jgi:hypothetical protein